MVLTFLVDFFKDWSGEHDSVKFARKTFIDSDYGIVSEVLLAWSLLPSRWIISDFKKIETFEHQTFDILSASFIINFYQIFDLFDGQLISCGSSVIEKHYQTHLNGAEDTIIITTTGEFGTHCRTSQRIAPFKLSVVIFILIVVLEMPHAWFELSGDLHVLEGLVSWPVTCCKNCNLKINRASFLFLLRRSRSLAKFFIVLCLFMS